VDEDARPPFGRTASVVWAVVAGIWMVVVLATYYSSAWPGAEQWLAIVRLLRPPTLAAAITALRHLYLAGWLCALMVLAGRPFLRRLRFDTLAEELLFAAGLGAGAIGMALFALAVVGLWYPALLAALAVMATVLLLPANRDLGDRLRSAMRGWSSRPRWGWTDRALLAVIVVSVGIHLLGALAPEVFYDSLGYHLALPRLWLLRHRMVPTPSICYAGIPALMEMLYGLALAVSDETVATLLHWAFGVAVLMLLALIARRLAGSRAALVAPMLLLTPPMLPLEFEHSMVELGACFLVGLSIWSLVRGLSAAEGASRWLLLSGALSGFALATKYTSATVLVGIGFALWVAGLATGQRRLWWRRWAVVASVAVAVVLPWLVKNALFYGNPFHPMLEQLVPAWRVSGFNAAGFRLDAQARPLAWTFGSWSGFLAWATELWPATMTWPPTGDTLGPAFLLSLPLLVFPRWTRRLGALAAAAAAGWLASSLVSTQIRFRLPSLTLACVVLAAGWSAEALPCLMRRAGAWLLLAVSITSLAWSGYWQWLTGGWRVVQGMTSKEAYLDRPHATYPSPYFAAAQFINRATPPGSGCIVLGDSRAYYLERPVLAASVFDEHPLLTWANESADGDALASRVERDGWRYILLNAVEARRIRSYFKGSLAPNGRVVLDQFWQKHTHELFREQGSEPSDARFALVFEIVPDRAALEPGVPRVVNGWFAALGEEPAPQAGAGRSQVGPS